MRRVRVEIAVALAWLPILCTAGPLLPAYVAPLGALIAVLLVLTPLARLFPAWQLATGAGAMTLGVSTALNGPIAQPGLPVGLLDAGVIAVTTFLVARFARQLTAVERTIVDVTVNHLEESVAEFDSGQTRLYEEVRRARRYNRALSLLAISADSEQVESSAEDLMRSVQRENLQRYVEAQIATIIAGDAAACKVMTRRNGHFLLLLPETDRDGAQQLAHRLSQQVQSRLGVPLHVGISSFPDGQITFTRLLESAETEMIRKTLVAETEDSAAIAPEPVPHLSIQG